MSKNRPFIPPPKMTLPDQNVSALASGAQASQISTGLALAPAQTAPEVPRATTATTIAIVPPPKREASVRILPDRIEYTNPTIELTEYIMPTAGVPAQTKRLTPDRAVVAHGMLIVEELHLSLPLGAFLIRT